MTFFEPDPAIPDVEADEPERDPRSEPAFDELAAIAPINALLAANEHVAIALAAVRVFSDGVEFSLERRMRRHGMSRADFRRLTEERRIMSDDEARASRLRYGVLLADGQRLTGNRPRFQEVEDAALSTDQHSLVTIGGSDGGSDSRYAHRDGLWLHPLPPAGPIELVTQWPFAGIEESRVQIDADLILTVVPHVRHLWGG
ncbi:hypothetical protein GCM10025867_05130 [Frondihabitans sucicola]|uniref:Uncharacterized protein n=1 Tax=Frondihabitans sucicola TaxID=1268041 RepID=A0ABM8GIR7_9MICO|nr:hypothetical protein [Frondihabitans sucicola]BDZ48272.1 hypothetical protein GCM10025867_05130 [Frondihabitans sucicola]